MIPSLDPLEGNPVSESSSENKLRSHPPFDYLIPEWFWQQISPGFSSWKEECGGKPGLGVKVGISTSAVEVVALLDSGRKKGGKRKEEKKRGPKRAM